MGIDIDTMASAITNMDSRLDFLLNMVESFYGTADQKSRDSITKKLATRIVDSFKMEPYLSDNRLLRAHYLLAKTSSSLGYCKYMETLDTFGYFKKSVEFYKLWAQYYVETSNRRGFDNLYQKAIQSGAPLNELTTLFEKLGEKLPLPNEDDGDTQLIFSNLTPKQQVIGVPLDVRAPPKQPLSEQVIGVPMNVRAPLKQPISEQVTAVPMNVRAPPKQPLTEQVTSVPVNVRAPLKQPLSVINEEVNKPTSEPANYSFTTILQQNACDAFGVTLPLSQEPVPSSNHYVPIQKDFSIFAEEDEESVENEPSKIHAATRIISFHHSARDSPVSKKARTRRDSDEDISIPNDPFKSSGVMKRSTLFDDGNVIEDPTISGFDRKANSRAMSTPSGKRVVEPLFTSPTEILPGISKELEDETPFTFAPSNAVVAPVKSPARIILPPLADIINRMSIAPDNDAIDETTHDVTIMPDVQINTGINPWSENERLEILKDAPPMVEQHEFLSTRCPSFNIGQNVNLGGENFKILDFIAQGGFARVYKTEAEDGKKFAIKLEMPACPWEVYMCKSLSCRLPEDLQPFVMSIRDAFIFSNASAIVYDYQPFKTLLDLSNAYSQDQCCLDGMVTTFIGIQIADILSYVHKAKIIHADIKPNNFLIVDYLNSDLPSQQYKKPFVKLIDFGRGIDMSYYPDTTFKGRAGTNGFDCSEMQEDRPWTYQTDFYGYVGTMHVLMFNCFMKTYFNSGKKAFIFVEVLKRRYPLYSTWCSIFQSFLNIPDCNTMPEWDPVITQLKEELEDFATEDLSAWKRSVDKVNSVLRKTVT